MNTGKLDIDKIVTKTGDKDSMIHDYEIDPEKLIKYVTGNGENEYRKFTNSPFEFALNSNSPHSLLVGSGMNEDAYSEPYNIQYTITPLDSNYFKYSINEEILPFINLSSRLYIMDNRNNNIIEL